MKPVDINNPSSLFTRCDCANMKEVMQAIKNSEISEDDLKKGFKDFKRDDVHSTVEEAWRSSRRYVKNFKDIECTKQNSILFCNTGRDKSCVGSGKTHLSLAIANNLMKAQNIPVYYMPYRQKITEIKQLVNSAEDYKRIMERLKKVKVLLIDDLYKGGSVTDADLKAVFEIINYRYLNKKPVIISTENSMEELLEVDEGIGSRIIEMSKDYLNQIGDSKNANLNYRLR